MQSIKITAAVFSMLAAPFSGLLAGLPRPVVTVTVDTLGNGLLNGPQGNLVLTSSLAADPGPGGASSVLTYPLLNPPSLVIGDVELTNSSGVTELLRFNAPGAGNASYPASLVFYSSPSDGASHLVNTPTPPTALYPNVVSAALGTVYTPGPGQPGYVAFVTTHYIFTPLTCSYSFSPSGANISAGGATGSFTVSAAAGCPVTPTGSSGLATLTVSGNTVNYTIGPNSDLQPRTINITVGGQTFSVNQAGGTLVFAPVSLSFTSGPLSGPSAQTVSVSGAQGTFSVSTNQPWVTVTSSSTQFPAILTISVNPSKLTPGFYSATITLNVQGIPESFSIQYVVQGLPSFVPVPAHLTFVYSGSTLPASQQLEIYSTSPISFQATGSGFASVTPTSGTTTQNVTISVDPSSLSVGTHAASVTITAAGITNSPLVVPIQLDITAVGPQFTSAAVVNAASFQTGSIAPGSLFTIFGSNLAPNQELAAGAGLPLSLNGVSITIGGIPAAVQFVSPSQINAQAPVNVPLGQQQLLLALNGSSTTVPVTIASTAPGIFQQNGRSAILNQDFSMNGPQNPAAAGTVVQVFFTGQGAVTPSVNTGAPASLSSLSSTNATTTATIGTATANVLFSGLAPGMVGLGQANVMVPNLSTNDYPLVLTVNGVASNSGVVAVMSQ